MFSALARVDGDTLPELNQRDVAGGQPTAMGHRPGSQTGHFRSQGLVRISQNEGNCPTNADRRTSTIGSPWDQQRARTFVRWAVQEPAPSPRRIPLRKANSRPVLDQNERLRLLRETLDNHHIAFHHRAAAVMLLLYSQPLTRIASMRTNQISRTGDDETVVVFHDQPVPVPHPFDDILQQHLIDRPNMNTAANPGTPRFARSS